MRRKPPSRKRQYKPKARYRRPDRYTGMQGAAVGKFGDMADLIDELTKFQFSDVAAKQGYDEALKQFCKLKRQAFVLLNDCGLIR